MPENLSFFRRLAIAWKVLTDPAAAASALAPARGPRPESAPALQSAPPDAALQMLGLLQQEGRLVDFLNEDVAGYSDAEIGAAARVVHEGCRKALQQHLTIAPVRDEAENSRVTLPQGFDAGAVRVTGNVVGEPPFTGRLVHRGWKATELRLPKVAAGHDVSILAAAEVEL